MTPLEEPIPGQFGSIAWTRGGIPVCATESGQFSASATSDNNGGVIATWIDYRRLNYDVYAMRLDGNGNRLWPPDGVAVALCDSFVGPLATVPDGSGGAFIVFGVSSSSDFEDVRAQHLTSAGGIAPGWPPNGRSTVPGGATGYGAVPTNDGNLLMGWSDLEGQVRVVRLTGAGALASGWTAAGLAIGHPQNDNNINPAPDGAGGGYICWAESDSVRLTRVAATGGFAPGWTAAGTVVITGFSLPALGLAASPLTGGNVMVFWADFRSFTDADIYALRYDAAGTPGAGWPATGALALGGPGYEVFPAAISDGAGGAVMVCETAALSPVAADSLLAQRVTGTGTLATGWTANGVTVGRHPNKATTGPISDGLGGVIAAWSAMKTVDDGVFAQRVGGAGALASGWPRNGRTVSDTTADQNEATIVPDGASGLIAVWEDYRGGNGEAVYAGRVLSDGTVGTLAALVSASAEPGLARLHWFSGGGAAFEAGVERAQGDGAFAEIARVRADGSGHVRYEDRDVVAGKSYRYRLAVRENGATSYLGEVALRVPEGLRLALAGFVPNPVVGVPRLSYTLATGERARIEVLDAAGRRVAERELESTPGEHVVSFEGAALSPGVYVLRLTQGSRAVTARAAIVR